MEFLENINIDPLLNLVSVDDPVWEQLDDNTYIFRFSDKLLLQLVRSSYTDNSYAKISEYAVKEDNTVVLRDTLLVLELPKSEDIGLLKQDALIHTSKRMRSLTRAFNGIAVLLENQVFK